MSSAIPAAGTVPWRRRRGQLEVALVHRPKYDDWSWAKGKLDPGEDWATAAVRETLEETSLEVTLGRPLPKAEYTGLDGSGEPGTKEVRYWAAEAVKTAGPLANEVDEVRWLDVAAASDRLDYSRDREQLRALVRADKAGTLTTWPLVLVRHAQAVGRGKWPKDDQLRPLDQVGTDRAADIAPVLAAYGVARLVSSPSLRCTDTLRPYAAQLGLPVRLDIALPPAENRSLADLWNALGGELKPSLDLVVTAPLALPSSVAATLASEPPNLPTAVRAAETMTMSSMMVLSG